MLLIHIIEELPLLISELGQPIVLFGDAFLSQKFYSYFRVMELELFEPRTHILTLI